MAEIEVKITKDRTPELFQKLEAAIGRFVRKGVFFLGGQVKAKMAEPKTGRMYGTHRASAPGEPPAVDSGNLIGSIVEIFPSTLEGLVGTPVPYARFLEDGTSRMKARPAWEVTRTESLPTLEQMLDAEIAGIGKRT